MARKPFDQASVAERCLSQVGSAIQYLEDRGEMQEEFEDVGVKNSGVRYTSEAVDEFYIRYDGKLIKLTAQEVS